MIETDAPGGDPDDEGSLVRWFLYTAEWDVEGILATRRADQSRTGADGKATLLGFIDNYESVYSSLVQHDARFPPPATLRTKVAASFTGTEARDLIIAAVDRPDPRPLWYTNFGTDDKNLTGMRHALDHVRATRTPAEYMEFTSKIHFSRDAARTYHLEASQDPSDPSNHIPAIPFWVDTRDPNAWYHRFEPLTANAGGFNISRDVKSGHGPLTARYTIQKEGDTPGFLYLVPTGLGHPMFPTWGSWAGRSAPRKDFRTDYNPTGFFWADGVDAWNGTTHRDNTLARWAVHIQNDFRARADWCVTARGGANHPPVPALNWTGGLAHVEVRARPGARVQLTAQGTVDPDEGDTVSFEWFEYGEPGTVDDPVTLSSVSGSTTSFVVPSTAARGQTIHVVLVATDDGSPPLTRYRRAVVVVE